MSKIGYIIPIKGLSLGKHEFDFEVEGDLFKEFENDRIFDADLVAKVLIDKSQNLVKLKSSIKGEVKVLCDRCLGELLQEVDITPELLIKYSRSEGEADTEDVMTLDRDEGELDLKSFFYDYISLSLPIVTTHNKNECDPEMLAKLGQLSVTPIEKSSNPFEALKDLFKK